MTSNPSSVRPRLHGRHFAVNIISPAILTFALFFGLIFAVIIPTMKKIVIVGGVAGGASAAAKARRVDENADIQIFERGPYISFANCGLPYYIAGEIPDRSKLLIMTPEGFWSRARVRAHVRKLRQRLRHALTGSRRLTLVLHRWLRARMRRPA